MFEFSSYCVEMHVTKDYALGARSGHNIQGDSCSDKEGVSMYSGFSCRYFKLCPVGGTLVACPVDSSSTLPDHQS